MVVQLLQPIFLWGLLGLLVPLLIHLLHKRSSKIIKVGSLQPFRGGTPVQARRLQPNELLMLLLRCLLLVLFVLLLCRPVLLEEETLPKQYLFIAPELAAASNADSLLEAGIVPRLLQPGLPLLAAEVVPDTSRYSYWDVFREIEALEGLGDTVNLLFYPRQERFQGVRPQLSREYHALPLPEQAPAPVLARALEQPENKLLLQWWEQQQGLWRLMADTLPLEEAAQALAPFGSQARVEQPDTLALLLQYGTAFEQEAARWQEALQLIDSLAPQTLLKVTALPAAQAPAASPDVWVWLSEEAPPAAFWQQPAGLRLSLKTQEGRDWFVAGEDYSHYYILQSLQQLQHDRARLAAFLPQLQALLPLQRAQHAPPLLVPEGQWKPLRAPLKAVAGQQQSTSLEYPLWLVLLLVFIVERWLSLRK